MTDDPKWSDWANLNDLPNPSRSDIAFTIKFVVWSVLAVAWTVGCVFFFRWSA